MKILFITRSYSNKKGGKEIYNYNLVKSLSKKNNIELISTSGSIFNLIWFYPYAIIKGLFKGRESDIIHLGDNFMLPLGLIIKKILKKRLTLTTYGLELTYQSKIYRKLFLSYLKEVDKIIAISNETKKVTEKITNNKILIIPCGVNLDLKLKESKYSSRNYIKNKYGINVNNKKIIITVGRLVKRKGVEWFVSNVMSSLSKDHIYLISGEGKEKENIVNKIKKHKLEKSVFLLGRTNDSSLKHLYNASDVFVMPNIKVNQDMEGFGIVALESASVGVPVVASNIEGIKDAVKNNVTGFLVNEKNTNEFIKGIKKSASLNKIKMMNYIENNFTWDKIADRYMEIWR